MRCTNGLHGGDFVQCMGDSHGGVVYVKCMDDLHEQVCMQCMGNPH